MDDALLLAGWKAAGFGRDARREFARDPRSQQPFFIELLGRWETILKAARWVIVESYEWESGLE